MQLHTIPGHALESVHNDVNKPLAQALHTQPVPLCDYAWWKNLTCGVTGGRTTFLEQHTLLLARSAWPWPW